nr:hypothetical protein [Tanacetum cinerariifolium]
MVAILEKYEHNVDFHHIVDFVEASHIRYTLTINPTVYVSHIRQFWSTARIKTTDEGTKILATMDGKPRTIFESSIRRNLKLNDEAGISSLPDADLFENLALMGTVPLFDSMLVHQGEGSGTPTKPHHTPSPEAQQSPQDDLSSSIHPSVTTETIPTVIPYAIPTLRQYSRRARIAQSSALPTAADEPASSLGDDSQGEACLTVSGLEVERDRANINKTSTLPHDSTPRVTSLAADEGSMQHQLTELTDLCTRLQRQHTEMATKIAAQDLEIASLKARIKLLEDKYAQGAEPSGEDATIKGRSLEIVEEAGIEKSTKRGSNDTEELVNVLTSLDAASILSSGVQVVSVPPAVEVATISVLTGSGMVPTASIIFTTASRVTPYARHKGKEKMVESDTPKKKKLQEQIDGQVAREIEEQIAREDQRRSEQIARDAEIARIHVEEELQMLIDGLDKNNEVIARHLHEYEQAAAELTIGEKIELINELVKYQDHHSKIQKYQAQQSKPLSKKQQREFYMSVLKSHSGWKTKHFKGMSLEEIREKFIPVWKQIEDFVPMASKEEGERIKRKGLRLEQSSAKKIKTAEDVSKKDLKQMIQLVPVEEVYMEALQNNNNLVSQGSRSNLSGTSVNTADSKPIVNYSRPISNAFKRGHSQVIRPYNNYSTYKKTIFNKIFNIVRVKDSTARERVVKEYKEKGIIDSGCSRHMIGNKCYLTDYEDYDGGFVSFGDGKCRIFGKGKIKTRTLDFDDVYFCNELKYNLFSVSQMCDKKNNVLFTDTECLVLSFNFKLLDESQVLLRVLRKDNIYSVDLKSVVPIGDNTACYVLNRALVIKPHNKTPYELIHKRPPLIDFMKPFGYPVTILNTRDSLGKFDGKADKGFCVGYSVVRKQTNGIVGTKDNIVAGQAKKKKEPKQEYILIPICTNNPLISQGLKDSAVDASKKATKVDESRVSDNGGHDDQVTRSEFEGLLQQESTNAFEEHPFEREGSRLSRTLAKLDSHIEALRVSEALFSPFKNAFSFPHVPIVTLINDTGIFGNAYDDEAVEEEVDMNNVVSSYTILDAPLTKFLKDHPKDQVIGSIETPVQTRQMTKINKEHAKKPVQALKDPSWVEAMQDELLQFKLLKVWTLVDLLKDKYAIGTKWVFRNKKDERGIVVKNKARLVSQGHTQEECIDYDEIFAPVVRIEAIRLFLAYASFKDFVVYQMDVKSTFLYGKIEEEVYVCQPPGFENLDFPDKVYKVEKALYRLHQAPRACQEKYVADILKKFDFTNVKTASTPIEPNKALVKDAEAKDVDVHLCKSMIGSLMYLTASRPDITFAVCACVRFQVTSKTSHLFAIKRIFRYLKGQPKLGLWYPRDSPFDLESYSDSDYAGASLDRKSTTRVKTVNDDVRLQALLDGKKVIVNETSIRRDIRLDDAEGTACLPNDAIFKGFTRMGYEKPSQKLTFYKAFFSPQCNVG